MMSEKDGDRIVHLFQNILDQREKEIEESLERLRRTIKASDKAEFVWIMENTQKLIPQGANLN